MGVSVRTAQEWEQGRRAPSGPATALLRIAEQMGVANVHPHRFHHTFAITFLRNGGSPLLLQALLGHARRETVQFYVRLAEQDSKAARPFSPADAWRL